MKGHIALFLIVLLLVSFISGLVVFSPTSKAATNTKTMGVSETPTFPDVKVIEDSSFITVDNGDGFVWQFAKDTAGYNIVALKGETLVANEQWVLEQPSGGSNWKQVGTPQKVSYRILSKFHVLVTRFYDNFLGTTFNVTYSFVGGARTKITVEGNIAEAGEYRLQWQVSGVNKQTVSVDEKIHVVKFSDSILDADAVTMDYSDVYKTFGDITTSSLTAKAGDQKVDQIFNVGVLPTGYFVLDPSFGNTNVTSAGSIEIRDDIRGTNFTATDSGTITNGSDYMTAYLSTTAANNIILAIYDSSFNFMAHTEEKSINSGSAAWFNFTFTNVTSATITSGNVYWLVAWGQWQAGTPYLYYHGGEPVTFALCDDPESWVDPVTFPEPLAPSGYSADTKACITITYTASGGDSTAPTYSDLSSSTTVAGASCQFNATFDDDTTLESNGQGTFETNNTGPWVAESPVNFSSTPETLSVSKTLNTTVGLTVAYRWNFTDNAGNSNTTGIQTLVLTDGDAPTFGAITTNTTITSAGVLVSCTVSDNNAIDKVIYEWNNTGTPANQTALSGSGTSYIANLTGTWNATVGYVVSVKVYANDTANNQGTSTQYNFTLTADSYTVTLIPSLSTQTLGNSIIITIGISRTTGTAVTDYKLNITKDGTLYKENFTDTQFSELEINPTGHKYDVTGLVDEDASTSVTPTCVELTLTWIAEGPGGGGGDTPSSPSQSIVTFSIDALNLGTASPNSTVSASLHFVFANSSFSLFGLSLDEPFQQWYSGGNFSTETIYVTNASNIGKGGILLNFNIPDVATQTYSGTVTLQSIDSTGTVFETYNDIIIKVAPRGSGFAYLIKNNLGLVAIITALIIIGLVAIAVFVKRKH